MRVVFLAKLSVLGFSLSFSTISLFSGLPCFPNPTRETSYVAGMILRGRGIAGRVKMF